MAWTSSRKMSVGLSIPDPLCSALPCYAYCWSSPSFCCCWSNGPVPFKLILGLMGFLGLICTKDSTTAFSTYEGFGGYCSNCCWFALMMFSSYLLISEECTMVCRGDSIVWGFTSEVRSGDLQVNELLAGRRCKLLKKSTEAGFCT